MRTGTVVGTIVMIFLTGVLLYLVGEETDDVCVCQGHEWPMDQDEEEDAI